MAVDNEKKRSTPDSLNSPHAKKLKPMQELSESGPLTQADVVYFQKEAIWRQMIQYKQQMMSMRLELIRLQRESDALKHIVTVLTAWYEQILALFDELNSEETSDLLLAITKNDDEQLDLIRKKLSNLISSKVTFDSAKYEKVSGELALLSRQNEQMTEEKRSLGERIDELESKITELAKEHERAQSKTLKRLDSQRHIKTVVDSEELDNLKCELDKLKTANQLLVQQVEQLTKENQLLIQKSLNLENKLHNLEESDLEDNTYYKKIVKNNQSLQEQIGKLTKLNSSNVSRLNELERQQNDLKSVIEGEIIEENEKLKQQLQESENNLVRIRTTRDELLSKNNILTSQLQDKKTNESLVELNNVLSKRVDLLSEERLESIVGTPRTGKLEDLSQQELIHKISQLNNEIKEVELAFKQTREITLKKLTSSIDQENLTKKLSIEKNKADQKYFSAMRVKDSLTNENKLLKAQIAKSQDLIKNLNDLEKKYLNKIDLLSNQLVDFRIIKENSLAENSKLHDELKTLNIAQDALHQEVERVNAKLESTLKEHTDLQESNKKRELELAKLQKQLQSTENILQKYKTNHTNSLLQEDEQQLEALRSIAKCSVCSKNWKDTAITVCRHVFCTKCTKERLRRCPSCNRGFSANDLLSIHL